MIQALLNKTELGKGQNRIDLGLFIGPDLDQFKDYGCWCYFPHHQERGKGHAVNFIDQLCKELQEGYDCSVLDLADACEPWTAPYIPGSGNGRDNLVANCERFNSNECSQKACIAE